MYSINPGSPTTQSVAGLFQVMDFTAINMGKADGQLGLPLIMKTNSNTLNIWANHYVLNLNEGPIPKPELRATHLASFRHSPCPTAKREPELRALWGDSLTSDHHLG